MGTDREEQVPAISLWHCLSVGRLSITRRPLTGRSVLSASQAQSTKLMAEVGWKLGDSGLMTGTICKR